MSKRIALSFASICALIALIFGLVWVFYLRHIEYTDDAYVQGNQVYITPLHDGFVTSIHTDDSFLVQKGQLIVTLDETDAKIGLQHAQEHLAQTVRTICEQVHQVYAYRSEIDGKTAALIRDAQDYLHRYGLFRVQGVSIEDYEHALASLRSGYAQLRTTGALYDKTLALVQNTSISKHPLVMQAVDRLRDAWVRLYRCKIYAPVDGLVAQRTIQVGMWVPEGKPLMSIIPLDQIWVNANYKETQLKHVRLGQTIKITTDYWGFDCVFHGKIVGLPGGAGNVFSLLPPQNLSGNWIKIVQRLPVRVALDPDEIKKHPLRLGLSCHATVDTRDSYGALIPDSSSGSPLYETTIFEKEENGVEECIRSIIAHNIDPKLKQFEETPFSIPTVSFDLPPLLKEAFEEETYFQSEVFASPYEAPPPPAQFPDEVLLP